MSAHRTVSDHAYSDWKEADPGTAKKIINSGRQGTSILPLVVGSGAETNTLADPERPGLFLTLVVYTGGGGTRTVTTATKVNQTGNNTLAFTQEADMLVLQSIPYASNTARCRWQIVSNDGVTLSTV